MSGNFQKFSDIIWNLWCGGPSTALLRQNRLTQGLVGNPRILVSSRFQKSKTHVFMSIDMVCRLKKITGVDMYLPGSCEAMVTSRLFSHLRKHAWVYLKMCVLPTPGKQLGTHQSIRVDIPLLRADLWMELEGGWLRMVFISAPVVPFAQEKNIVQSSILKETLKW